MNKSYDVELDDAQRRFLLKVIKTGHEKPTESEGLQFY